MILKNYIRLQKPCVNQQVNSKRNRLEKRSLVVRGNADATSAIDDGRVLSMTARFRSD